VFLIPKEDSRRIRMFDLSSVDNVKETVILDEHPDDIICITLSPKDEFLAVGLQNGEVRIYKRISLNSADCEFELAKTLNKHVKTVSCLAFSLDLKYFATGSWDITTKVFDISNDF